MTGAIAKEEAAIAKPETLDWRKLLTAGLAGTLLILLLFMLARRRKR